MEKESSRYWIDRFDLFCVKGKDSKRFLNGITTSNISSNDNNIIKTCWLTPTGNLRAMLEIYNNSNESNGLLVLVLIGDVNEIKNYCLDLIFPSDDITLGDTYSSYRLQEIDNLNQWRKFNPILLSEMNYRNYCLENKLDLLSCEELKEWKVNQAIPRFKTEVNGKNNPLELGLSDLIDFNKGCYLGQETMAKLKNVSFLKQEIRIWKSTCKSKNLNLDDNKIFLDNTKKEVAGLITSFDQSKDLNYHGLVFIKKKYLQIYFFYSDQFGKIKINKSIGSVFL